MLGLSLSLSFVTYKGNVVFVILNKGIVYTITTTDELPLG